MPAGTGPVPVWKSDIQTLSVDVRGVFPFAGNTVADGDDDRWHRDGTGPAARFREPFGLAEILGRDGSGKAAWSLLVSDPSNHVLRLVDREGRVTSLAGDPGLAGHRDSPCWLRSRLGCAGESAPALFNRPTHVAVQRLPAREGGRGWRAFVADSGSHVIRQVEPDGRVSTVAGCAGIEGSADRDDPRLSLFRDPQGLCAAEGHLFVADRGNCAVRRIESCGGRVRTLAGFPGRAGAEDGVGKLALFTDLKGMACAPEWGTAGPCLYVVDGHAVRRINLESQAVTTVLGAVREPGFRDVTEGSLEDRQAALLQPCLRDPVGVLWSLGLLYVADRGNHALRRVDLLQARLETLAGDPAHGETRWGLLREGLPGALAAPCAALEAPATVASGPEGLPLSLLAPTGRGLAELRPGGAVRDRLEAALGDLAPAERGRDLVVPFRAGTWDAAGHATEVPLHCSVDFLEPDGTLAVRKEVVLPQGGEHSLTGAFTQSGTGEVVLRVVSGQGIGAGARRAVTIP